MLCSVESACAEFHIPTKRTLASNEGICSFVCEGWHITPESVATIAGVQPFGRLFLNIRRGHELSGLHSARIRQRELIPLPGVLEFGEAEAGAGFAGAGEKLLQQPFFLGLERGELLAVAGNHLVQRRQALGDLALLGFVFGKRNLNVSQSSR